MHQDRREESVPCNRLGGIVITARRQAFLTIDIEIQPRRIGAKATEYALQSRRIICFIDDIVRNALQLTQSQIASILHKQFKNTGRS